MSKDKRRKFSIEDLEVMENLAIEAKNAGLVLSYDKNHDGILIFLRAEDWNEDDFKEKTHGGSLAWCRTPELALSFVDGYNWGAMNDEDRRSECL